MLRKNRETDCALVSAFSIALSSPVSPSPLLPPTPSSSPQLTPHPALWRLVAYSSSPAC